jgi:hypothetical protein
MATLAVIDTQKNRVLNLVSWDGTTDPSTFNQGHIQYVPYDQAIHPWSYRGREDIDIGPNWLQVFEEQNPPPQDDGNMDVTI